MKTCPQCLYLALDELSTQRVLSVSPRLRALAHSVLTAIQQREPVNLEDWAQRLAEDVVKAGD